MQPLNKEYVLPTPFSMTGVYQMPDILLEGDWAVKIDLSNGECYIMTCLYSME